MANREMADMIKLGIYIAFFFMLLMFYGLPIHIMRDLFMTSRDFVKRLHSLLRYRRSIQEMNRYPDATAQDLAQENTCIICREEMRPWDPVGNPGAVDRVRPKKLPCSHILHLVCLKSWLERQQVCPTCRSPVTADGAHGAQNGAAGIGIQLGGALRAQGQQAPAANDEALGGRGRPDEPQQARRDGGPRIFNLGPIRLGFGGNGQQVRELAQQFGVPQMAGNPPAAAAPAPIRSQSQPTVADNLQHIGSLIQQSEQMVQREMQRLHMAQQELQIAQLLMAELQRLQQRRQQPQEQQTPGPPPNMPMNLPFPSVQQAQLPAQGHPPQFPGLPIFPGVPPRSGSPLMARLGATANTPAIPAGSAELPEGMTLPPGWSLMPLQRLDGAPNLAQPPQPGTPLHGDPATAQRPTNESSYGTVPAVAQAAEAALPANSGGAPSSGHGLEAAPGARAAEPAAMAAPSPVMPSWGGSAQLFNSAPRDRAQTEPGCPQSETSETPAGSSSAAEVAGQESGAGNSDPVEQAEESLPKGKGRAVSVEEAREEE